MTGFFRSKARITFRPPRKQYRMLTALLAVLLTILLATGCSFSGRQQLPIQSYVLGQESPGERVTASSATPCVALRITRPTSAPGLSTSRMAYQLEPHRFDHFAYHQWVDTPARMLESLITRRLESAGLFSAVLSGSPDIKTDYRLDSELTQFVQVFEAGSSHVILRIKFSLIDLASRSLAFSHVLSYEEAARARDPESGVAAANRAADRMVNDLVAALTEYYRDVDCAGAQLRERT